MGMQLFMVGIEIILLILFYKWFKNCSFQSNGAMKIIFEGSRRISTLGLIVDGIDLCPAT